MTQGRQYSVVLTFHAIDEKRSVLSLAPGSFSDLIRGASRSSQFQPLDKLVNSTLGGEPGFGNDIAITFDDGYDGVYHHAYPLLAKLRISATIFVCCDWIGNNTQPHPGNGHTMLNWSQLGELADHGFSIGCHTFSHPDLRRLSSEAIRNELVGSRALLEDRLQVDVKSFAYPFGYHDARSVEIVGEVFDFAVTDEFDVLRPGCDRRRLPRVESYYFRRRPARDVISSRWLNHYVRLRNYPRMLRRALEGPTR